MSQELLNKYIAQVLKLPNVSEIAKSFENLRDALKKINKAYELIVSLAPEIDDRENNPGLNYYYQIDQIKKLLSSILDGKYESNEYTNFLLKQTPGTFDLVPYTRTVMKDLLFVYFKMVEAANLSFLTHHPHSALS